jgi:hypothetical protein
MLMKKLVGFADTWLFLTLGIGAGAGFGFPTALESALPDGCFLPFKPLDFDEAVLVAPIVEAPDLATF